MTTFNSKDDFLNYLNSSEGSEEIKFKDYDGKNFILDVLDWDNDCKTYIENGGVAVPLTKEMNIKLCSEEKVINVWDKYNSPRVVIFYYEKQFKMRPEKRAMVIAIARCYLTELERIIKEEI